MTRKLRVFLDTNIIIESFRIGCWNEICERHSIETVEKCVEEAMTGDQCDPQRVDVDSNQLNSRISVIHQVTTEMRLRFLEKHPNGEGLDDGELHLLAFLSANDLFENAIVLLSTADRAAIVVAAEMVSNTNGLDSLVSLEYIAGLSGVSQRKSKMMKKHYLKEWLSDVKTSLQMRHI
ncbi:hypothetical protein HMI48_10385 [Acidithiobacillus ferrooxidans]|uniref:hypothetical protein n=1 Tax=Acidithiobacillus ferrooxidans TaxID=920 RepID=UPI001C0721A7|nr:hypothetical protein [Acidithiobacillus ferrooxidans]MBU2774270.1 hypothetical protein [Acidithiobacillus ferrooxidans]